MARIPLPGGTTAADPGRAALLLIAVILLWGVNWPVMKVALDSIPPFWFGAARMALGAATLFAVLLWRGELRLPGRPDLPIIVSVGLLQMALFLACINTGLEVVEAGRSALLVYTTPLWVTPAAMIIFGERMGPLKTLGWLLGLGGLAVLFNPFGFDWQTTEVLLGNGLLLLGAFAWAVALLHVRGHRWHLSPLQLAPWQMLLALPLLLTVALITEPLQTIEPSWSLAAVLFYNGPIATAFCFWAALTVTRSLPAITTSLGFLGVPMVGVAAATLWLQEPVTATLTIGLLLMLTGLAVVNLSERRT
ncbi:DMT family transporter [Algihabitans sp.]|uniref:DMT family transporter n=1 Tax=Algihabitans sp. TaxID=2821514 RepID=UPI003BAA4972